MIGISNGGDSRTQTFRQQENGYFRGITSILPIYSTQLRQQ
jgi:hypothetical protein